MVYTNRLTFGDNQSAAAQMEVSLYDHGVERKAEILDDI